MKFLPQAISQTVARQGLKTAAASPKLLFVAGVGGMVASTVLACRATLKVSETLETAKADLAMSNQLMHLKDGDYTEQEHQKNVTVVYIRSAGKIVKLYGPSILLGVASIAVLTKSHNILAERNLALTAAYAAMEEAFGKYRGRVIEAYGEEVDERMRYDTETVEIIDGETGKIISQVRVGPDEPSMYARFFDEYCSSWSKDPEYNRTFLIHQQNYANDLLKVRGHVFLNEIYDVLGMERTRAGSVVGWIVSKDGDNYIDFGIWNNDDSQIRDFVNGREGSILLDFNVDGIIWDKISEGERLQWQK